MSSTPISLVLIEFASAPLSRCFEREKAAWCSCRAPGPVDTDMTRALGDDKLAAFAELVPLGRIASPDEVAGVITFLASVDAAYITGAVIPVDGGLGMGH